MQNTILQIHILQRLEGFWVISDHKFYFNSESALNLKPNDIQYDFIWSTSIFILYWASPGNPAFGRFIQKLTVGRICFWSLYDHQMVCENFQKKNQGMNFYQMI